MVNAQFINQLALTCQNLSSINYQLLIVNY